MGRISHLLLLVIIGVAAGSGAAAAAEESDKAALAKAVEGAKVTLEDGLKASEREGKPISAKFEIEDGKLQLSVYTLKGEVPTEVIVDPTSGAIREAEKISDDDDLKDAAAQRAAMAKASQALVAVAAAAVKANPGFRALSIVPRLTDGQPTAEVVLVQGTSFKTVAEKLD